MLLPVIVPILTSVCIVLNQAATLRLLEPGDYVGTIVLHIQEQPMVQNLRFHVAKAGNIDSIQITHADWKFAATLQSGQCSVEIDGRENLGGTEAQYKHFKYEKIPLPQPPANLVRRLKTEDLIIAPGAQKGSHVIVGSGWLVVYTLPEIAPPAYISYKRVDLVNSKKGATTQSGDSIHKD